MTASLKKLLLITVTLLFGVMSGSVMALTTDYIFTFSGNDGSMITGQFLNVDTTTGLIGGISGNVSGFGAYMNGPIMGIIEPGGFDRPPKNDNLLFPTTSPYVTNYGVAFFTNGFSESSSLNLYSTGVNQYSLYGANDIGGVFSATGSLTIGGAPEIDGSLAPKIALLLGCSYLMFGRKKQNTEIMATTA